MVNPDLPVPLWEQLAGYLRHQIQSGKLTGRVPSIVSLSQEHGVSHKTSARALDALRDEGLIVVVRGKGFYVRPPGQT